jgi:hypothetical protein
MEDAASNCLGTQYTRLRQQLLRSSIACVAGRLDPLFLQSSIKATPVHMRCVVVIAAARLSAYFDIFAPPFPGIAGCFARQLKSRAAGGGGLHPAAHTRHTPCLTPWQLLQVTEAILGEMLASGSAARNSNGRMGWSYDVNDGDNDSDDSDEQ